MKRIESTSNPLIQRIRRIHRRKKGEPSMLLEGKKLVATAADAGHRLEAVVVDASLDAADVSFPDDAPTVQVDPQLFRTLSTLESPEGILAIAARPPTTWERVSKDRDVVVSLGVQDPGNLGAIARVCEAAGAAALVVVKGSADPFAPKALRGSMGSLLRLPVVQVDTLDEIREHRRRFAALVPRHGVDPKALPRSEPLAIVLGRESEGLDESALEPTDLRVSIPMAGAVESLNVAVAAALVLYERTRPGR